MATERRRVEQEGGKDGRVGGAGTAAALKSSRLPAFLFICSTAFAACSEGEPTPPTTTRKPQLSIQQTAGRGVEIQIAGPRGLRALQAHLLWDPAVLRIIKIEPGRESKRLDRIFFNDPTRAPGALTFGLTDTRQVQLPARGALLALQLQPADASQATGLLRIEDALGVDEAAKAVPLEPATAEVQLK